MAMVPVGNGRVGSALVLYFRNGDDGLGVDWTKSRTDWPDVGQIGDQGDGVGIGAGNSWYSVGLRWSW